MGVDLTLIPFYASSSGPTYSYTALELNRHSDLWPHVRALVSKPVPDEFITLLCLKVDENREDDGCWHVANTQADANDEPLMCVSVGDLLAVKDHPAVASDWSNRAAWAYLQELPDTWLVALYWW